MKSLFIKYSLKNSNQEKENKQLTTGDVSGLCFRECNKRQSVLSVVCVSGNVTSVGPCCRWSVFQGM